MMLFPFFVFRNNHLNGTKANSCNACNSYKCSEIFVCNDVRSNESKCNKKVANNRSKITPKFVAEVFHDFFKCLMCLPLRLTINATKGSKKTSPNAPTKMFPKIYSIIFLKLMSNLNTLLQFLQAIFRSLKATLQFFTSFAETLEQLKAEDKEILRKLEKKNQL